MHCVASRFGYPKYRWSQFGQSTFYCIIVNLTTLLKGILRGLEGSVCSGGYLSKEADITLNTIKSTYSTLRNQVVSEISLAIQ